MRCQLCEIDVIHSFHHFIPRTVHRNKWFKKRFTKEEMRTSGIDLCKQCHDMLHELIPEKELGRNYNSREKLTAHPEVAKYLAWKRR
jgi:hypothetical protein